MDRRLAWMLALFGVLVVAGGILGFAKGSVASLASAGPLGLGILACGLLAVRGARAVSGAAIALTFLTAAVMAVRLTQTGKLVPGLPVGALALALCVALVTDRRRRAPGAPRR